MSIKIDVVDYMYEHRNSFKLARSFYWIGFDTDYGKVGCGGGSLVDHSWWVAEDVRCENCGRKGTPYSADLCKLCGKPWFKWLGRTEQEHRPSEEELNNAIIEQIRSTIDNAEGRLKEVALRFQYDWCQKNMPEVISQIFPADTISLLEEEMQ